MSPLVVVAPFCGLTVVHADLQSYPNPHDLHRLYNEIHIEQYHGKAYVLTEADNAVYTVDDFSFVRFDREPPCITKLMARKK